MTEAWIYFINGLRGLINLIFTNFELEAGINLGSVILAIGAISTLINVILDIDENETGGKESA